MDGHVREREQFFDRTKAILGYIQYLSGSSKRKHGLTRLRPYSRR